MGSLQKSLRIPAETLAAIEEIGAESGVELSVVANQLLEEAVRMREATKQRRARAAPDGRIAVVGQPI